MIVKLPLVITISLALVVRKGAPQSRGGYCQAREASCIMESFGYTPSCVMNALSACEENSLYSSIEREIKVITDTMSSFLLEQAPETRPRHCADLKAKQDTSGVRTIYPYDSKPNKPVRVYCDQSTDRGGWTMILRRENLAIRENYDRSWIEYVIGFGKINQEFWLGLDNIHALTNGQLMELRVDLEDWESAKRFAKYRYFHIGNSSTKYFLNTGGYIGDAGDSLFSEYEQYNHDGMKGMKFITLDNAGDRHYLNFTVPPFGGWWYYRFRYTGLNGEPLIGATASAGQGVNWHTFRGGQYSLKKASMMLRPAFNF